jgi:hypothetical protein
MKSIKSMFATSFLVLLASACGGKNEGPKTPQLPGKQVSFDQNSGNSTCTKKSCTKVTTYDISNSPISKGINEEFGNIQLEASPSGNFSSRKIKLFVVKSSLTNGLTATPSSTGFSLAGKIGVASSYPFKVFIRDLELCQLRSGSDSSSCETSDRFNSNYDDESTVQVTITAGVGDQSLSTVTSLPSACPTAPTNNNTNVLQTIAGAGSILGSVIDGRSTTGSVIGGITGILGGLFGPKPATPEMSVQRCR